MNFKAILDAILPTVLGALPKSGALAFIPAVAMLLSELADLVLDTDEAVDETDAVKKRAKIDEARRQTKAALDKADAALAAAAARHKPVAETTA